MFNRKSNDIKLMSSPEAANKSAGPKKKEWTLDEMEKDLRRGSIGMVIIGIISLSVPFLDPIWGVLLIAAALPPFFVKKRGFFILFGIVILLAGITNMIFGIAGSSYGWAVFGVLQVYLSVLESRKYLKYAAASDASGIKKDETTKLDKKSHSRFGIASFILSILAGVLMIVVFTASAIIAIVSGNFENTLTANIFGWLIVLIAAMPFIALLLGIVGLQQKHRVMNDKIHSRAPERGESDVFLPKG